MDEYNFYPTGEINIIIFKTYGRDGELLSEKRVEHFKDGRQPVVEIVDN